ncbi:MAG: helicase-related protein, partial [Methanobacterium sp.]
DSLVSVIGCPFNHLIHQWEKDLKSMKINHEIIIADSTNPKWKNQISNKILDINNKNKKFLTILTTHDTFSSPKFCNEIRKVKSDLFLIMDEVHGIGTPLRSKGLLDNYTYRLGLSATPERWFDKKGTKLIKDFFSETVYKFPLNKAINTINVNTGKTYLTPYEYKPYFVELNDSELMEYKKITKKIVKAYFGSKKEDSLNISSLYFKRQKIINEALNKLKVLKNIIRENKLEHCLVYCSSKQIKPIQEILNQKGIVQHKFTMKEGIKKSDEFGGESERGLILKKFSEGFYKVLVAIKCLDEGVDIPSAKIAIIMSSTSNPIQYIQRRGRILRRSYNKEKAVIYDMIVIPGFDILKDDYIRDFELKIIRKEFQRYKEFALSADNALECLKLLEDMELKYDLSL